MEELIREIKLKADSIPTNTEVNRRVKGAYIDCLMIVKEASNNPSTSIQSEQLVGFFKWINDYEGLKFTEKGIRFYVDEYLKLTN